MRDLGKLIDAKCFEMLPKVQKIAQSGHTVGGRPASSVDSASYLVYDEGHSQ